MVDCEPRHPEHQERIRRHGAPNGQRVDVEGSRRDGDEPQDPVRLERDMGHSDVAAKLVLASMAVEEQVERTGHPVTALPLSVPLPDSDDEAFLAVAASARAEVLVTGNLRYFPPHLRQGVRMATQAELVEMLRSGA